MKLRAAAAATLVAVGMCGLAGPAQAIEPDTLPDEVISARDSVPSQYVEASSPEEADMLLTQLESSGGSMSASAAVAASVRYGPCVLNPSVMYLRESSNYEAVGTKPYTTCTVPVTSIRHSTDLRYKSFIWWKKAGSTHTGGNSGVASYTQKSVEYYCKSSEKTGWSGTTAGTIVYAGRTYYARVYQTATTLSCGG